MSKDLYVPMNRLILDKETSWTFTNIHLSYIEIARKGIALWCEQNAEGRWTMLGGSKFGFESGDDAVMFKIKFGL